MDNPFTRRRIAIEKEAPSKTPKTRRADCQAHLDEQLVLDEMHPLMLIKNCPTSCVDVGGYAKHGFGDV